MFLTSHAQTTICQRFFFFTYFFFGFSDAAATILPGTHVQQLPGGFSPPVDHQSRSPLSRPAQRPEANVNSTHNQWVDREPVHLPEVPSHSPIKTGSSATREKARPLVSS